MKTLGLVIAVCGLSVYGLGFWVGAFGGPLVGVGAAVLMLGLMVWGVCWVKEA